MAKQSYKRISNVDEQPHNNNNNISNNTTTTTITTTHNKSLIQTLSIKLHALLYIFLSYITIQYTNTISIILTSTLIIRPLLYICIVLLGINFILLLYLTIYIPHIKQIKISQIQMQQEQQQQQQHNHNQQLLLTNADLWKVYCPRVIPIMTFNGVLCIVLLIRCFWNVWGFLTPFILSVEGFGLLFVSHFIPWL